MKYRRSGVLHLPALRGVLGDRGYFITVMRLSEVATRVKSVQEVHKSKKLCDWIQRELDEDHATAIANYLINEKSRFFSAIVVGVYGGDPQWAELAVSDPRDELSEDEEDRMVRSVGVLILSGRESLFPIDGQHRVSGIKRAVIEKPDLAEDEVTVIMVGHQKTEQGKEKTRRLFVTLNKSAKKVSERDIVALDENNGLAVVTRRMIDEFDLFQEGKRISFSRSVSIPESDKESISSILGVFQIVKALYPRQPDGWPKKAVTERSRPEEDVLTEVYDYNCQYWRLLVARVKEYRDVFVSGKREASFFRTPQRNHLLFRPAGQSAFAKAVECLTTRGKSLSDAVDAIAGAAEFSLLSQQWHNILWDPIGKKMLKHSSSAETLLLRMAGENARSAKAEERLDRIINERDAS